MANVQCVAHGVTWKCGREPISRKQLWCVQHRRQVERWGCFSRIRSWGVNHIRDSEGRKTCGGCLKPKSEDQFSRNRGAVDGLNSRCKSCNRRYQMSSKYGLTPTQFDEKLIEQELSCAACGTEAPGGHGWVVDHDHSCCPGHITCGLCVRGILCGKCNTALGLVGDNLNTLNQLINYLKENTL